MRIWTRLQGLHKHQLAQPTAHWASIGTWNDWVLAWSACFEIDWESTFAPFGHQGSAMLNKPSVDVLKERSHGTITSTGIEVSALSFVCSAICLGFCSDSARFSVQRTGSTVLTSWSYFLKTRGTVYKGRQSPFLECVCVCVNQH